MNIISVGTASIFSVQSVVGLNKNWREVGPDSRSELRGRCTVLYVVSFKGRGGGEGLKLMEDRARVPSCPLTRDCGCSVLCRRIRLPS